MKSLKLCGIALAVFAASAGRAQAQSSPPLTPSGNDQSAPAASCPQEQGADTSGNPAPAPAPAPEQAVAVAAPEPSQSWLDTFGFGIEAGGGVDAFAGSTMRDTTSTGGSWDVRAIFGTRSYIAFEASYIGSAQSINSLGLSNDAVLLGNGAQLDIRLNGTRFYMVQPFIYGGGAWRNYMLEEDVDDQLGRDELDERGRGPRRYRPRGEDRWLHDRRAWGVPVVVWWGPDPCRGQLTSTKVGRHGQHRLRILNTRTSRASFRARAF